jgi:hypothetical protein
MLGHNLRLMGLLEFIGSHGLSGSSLEERNLPLVHHVLHLLNVLLHSRDKVVLLRNDTGGFLDELIDGLGVPGKLDDTILKVDIHLLDSLLQERLLDWKKSLKDLVVLGNDNLKSTSLASVGIVLLVQDAGSLRDLDVQKEEILNLSEESLQSGIEVDSNEALLGNGSGFSYEQEFVQVNFGVLLNTLLPSSDLGGVVLLDVLAEGSVELLDILELFSILDGLRKE